MYNNVIPSFLLTHDNRLTTKILMKNPLGTDTGAVGDHKVEAKVITTNIKATTEATATTTTTAETPDTDEARDAEI